MKNKKTNKCLALLLSVLMMLSVLAVSPIYASAETTDDAITSGDYQYVLLDDGTAEITGYTGAGGEITIPAQLDGVNVTSIGADVFRENTAITKVTISDGIKKVGKRAFMLCPNITSISLPDTLTEISNGGFANCEKIEEIIIPDSVTVLGDNAFQSCYSAKTVKFPKDLTEISAFMLSGCENITEIEIPSTVKIIKTNSFTHCDGLTSVVIPEGVEYIEGAAFSYCTRLTSISLPSTVETIEPFAFSSCTSLMGVTVPDTVKEIGRLAFGYWFDKKVWNDVLLDGFVLKGYRGSAADGYAQEYNVAFESLGDSILTPPTTAAPTEPTTPPAPGTVNTVYYKNTNNFSKPTAYYWSSATDSGPVSWPGVAMTEVADGVYKIDIPAENDMIIFSNGGADQTGNLKIGGNNKIYEDGNWSDYSAVTTEPLETTVPVTTEPVTTEPVTTEPITTEPVTTDPAETTEPETTVPTVEKNYSYGELQANAEEPSDLDGDFDSEKMNQDMADVEGYAVVVYRYGTGYSVAIYGDGVFQVNYDSYPYTVWGGEDSSDLLYWINIWNDNGFKVMYLKGEQTPSEPVTTDPAETTEPVTTEPITTEPVSTEPITTEPETTEPESTEPSTPGDTDDGLLGDVNGDGAVNIKDVTLIQKAVADIEVLSEAQNKAADVNADGVVNIKDATAIQKYIAGIDTGLDIGT